MIVLILFALASLAVIAFDLARLARKRSTVAARRAAVQRHPAGRHRRAPAPLDVLPTRRVL
ncbi:MAG: hypothetical protein WBA38_11830 [Gordonia sp. (in: high G+C Gram-positive bacteria)]